MDKRIAGQRVGIVGLGALTGLVGGAVANKALETVGLDTPDWLQDAGLIGASVAGGYLGHQMTRKSPVKNPVAYFGKDITPRENPAYRGIPSGGVPEDALILGAPGVRSQSNQNPDRNVPATHRPTVEVQSSSGVPRPVKKVRPKSKDQSVTEALDQNLPVPTVVEEKGRDFISDLKLRNQYQGMNRAAANLSQKQVDPWLLGELRRNPGFTSAIIESAPRAQKSSSPSGVAGLLPSVSNRTKYGPSGVPGVNRPGIIRPSDPVENQLRNINSNMTVVNGGRGRIALTPPQRGGKSLNEDLAQQDTFEARKKSLLGNSFEDIEYAMHELESYGQY